MFLLRALIPLVACYATDCVAFDGDYFERFSTSFRANTAAQELASLPDLVGGSLALPDAGAYVRANARSLGLCPLDREMLACR